MWLFMTRSTGDMSQPRSWDLIGRRSVHVVLRVVVVVVFVVVEGWNSSSINAYIISNLICVFL